MHQYSRQSECEREQLDMLNGILKHVLTHGHMTPEVSNILKMSIHERDKTK